jgi:hypothetical protein
MDGNNSENILTEDTGQLIRLKNKGMHLIYSSDWPEVSELRQESVF